MENIFEAIQILKENEDLTPNKWIESMEYFKELGINKEELCNFSSNNCIKDELLNNNENAIEWTLKQYMNGYFDALFIEHFLSNDNILDKYLANQSFEILKNNLIERTFDLETLASEFDVQITDGPYCKIFVGDESNLEQFRQNLTSILRDNQKNLDIDFDDMDENIEIDTNNLKGNQIDRQIDKKQNKKQTGQEKNNNNKNTVKKKVVGKKVKYKKVKIKTKIKEIKKDKSKFKSLDAELRAKELEMQKELERKQKEMNKETEDLEMI